MAESNDCARHVRLSDNLSPQQRIKVLLMARGFTVASWARARGWHDSQVWMCISGDRPYPEIRDSLAAELDLTRAEINRLIDGDAGQARVPA